VMGFALTLPGASRLPEKVREARRHSERLLLCESPRCAHPRRHLASLVEGDHRPGVQIVEAPIGFALTAARSFATPNLVSDIDQPHIASMCASRGR
jgi:hypothetical protein